MLLLTRGECRIMIETTMASNVLNHNDSLSNTLTCSTLKIYPDQCFEIFSHKHILNCLLVNIGTTLIEKLCLQIYFEIM